MKHSEQSFEQAVKQLASLVEQIESQSLSLEDALKAYEQGMRLSQFCQQQLAQAKQRVQIVQSGQIQPLDRGVDDESPATSTASQGVVAPRDLDDDLPF